MRSRAYEVVFILQGDERCCIIPLYSLFFLGGDNTPLNETSFDGITPKTKNISTPNVFLGTPFRSPSQSLASTPGRMMTPQITNEKVASGFTTPSQTPLRDQFSINPDSHVDSFSDVSMMKQQQNELRAQLKAGLGSLPTPRNDFEIVLPGNEMLSEEVVDESLVEDASEVEERVARRNKVEGKYHVLLLYLACNLYMFFS